MSAPDIFQVEDNFDFSCLMEYAIKEVDEELSLTITPNGRDALTLLNRFTENKSKAGLILLDVDLPGISGIELLKKIRENDYLKSVPVVMFSTSDNPKDVKTSMEYGANAYQVKPMGYRELVNCLKTLQNKWLHK